MIFDLFSVEDKKRNRAKFFFNSLFYDSMCHAIPSRPHSVFAEMIASEKPATVLDVCSGTCYTTRVLARLLPASQINALDISPEMLSVARERSETENLHNIRFYEQSAAQLPFESDSFDAVFISLGLHELPTEIRSTAMKEIFRVIKPGGRFFIMDLDKPDNFGFLMDFYLAIGEPEYAKDVLAGRLVKLLQKFGFEKIKKTSLLADFFQVIVAGKPANA